MTNHFETLHTYTVFYDCPREGVANFNGEPHFYRCEWDDEADDFAAVYRLTPISGETLTLALEAWNIWSRWQIAFHGGNMSGETFPAPEEDRERSEMLRKLLTERLVSNPLLEVRATAEFSYSIEGRPPMGDRDAMRVRWTKYPA